jgi:hypothetical protein
MLKRKIVISATMLSCSLFLAPTLQALPRDGESLLARLASWVSVVRHASPASPARAARTAPPAKPRIASKNGCGIDPQGQPLCSGW